MKITDWFKEIVKDNKELNLRIGIGVLATIMVASGLSGCVKNKEEQEKESTSVSDTMNEENKELTFNNPISSDLFLDNYDFDTEVSKTDNETEIREYLYENKENCYLWMNGPDFSRKYEIIGNNSDDNGMFYQIFSIRNKKVEGKYKYYFSLNDKYSLLTEETLDNCVLNHETGTITKMHCKNGKQINDSYLIGTFEGKNNETVYKLFYVNGKEALPTSYKNAVWDLYNEENVNILFLSTETYTDMVNLSTREVKRLDNLVVQKTYSNYMIGETIDHVQYVFSYDGFDISKISEVERVECVLDFVLAGTDFPNLIVYNSLMGKEYIRTMNGKMLSNAYDEINGIANVGDHSTLHYYIGYISRKNYGMILNSNGEFLTAINPEEEFCYGVFNDNIFLIEYKKENKKAAFKIEDGKIMTVTGDDIELIANKGLFIHDEDSHSIYAYDTNLTPLETIDQDDLDRRNEVLLQIQGDKGQSKVKEKK